MPIREPGIPLSKIVDNSPANWWPLIAVAFIAVAFVSGFIGYVVRAPQAEMARLNKLLKQEKAGREQAEKDLAVAQDLNEINDGLLKAAAAITPKKSNLGFEPKIVEGWFADNGIKLGPREETDTPRGRLVKFLSRDLLLMLELDGDKVRQVELIGEQKSDRFTSSMAVLCGNLAPDWHRYGRAAWLLKAMTATKDANPELSVMYCNQAEARFSVMPMLPTKEGGHTFLFSVKPTD